MKLVMSEDWLELYNTRDGKESLVLRMTKCCFTRTDVIIRIKRYRYYTVTIVGYPWDFRNIEEIEWRGVPGGMPTVETIDRTPAQRRLTE